MNPIQLPSLGYADRAVQFTPSNQTTHRDAMAYSVQSAFDQFYERINLTGDHRATANARRDSIVSLLENHFEILEAFGSGSIPRFTALKSMADLDVTVVLHYGKHIKDKTPTQVLQGVRDALGTYRNQVRKNGQAVTLFYKTWPNVDIVPVSRSADVNGNITHYNVPDANTGAWIESNPKEHASDVDSRAGICGANFRMIIKMIKAWNGAHSNYLQSYHIEVMALKTFQSSLSDLPWDVYWAFKSFKELVANPLYHRRGYADAYLTPSDRFEVSRRLTTAMATAQMAWYLGNKGDTAEAIKSWLQVFGGSFPAYG